MKSGKCACLHQKQIGYQIKLETNTAVLDQSTKSNFYLNSFEHVKSISDVAVPLSLAQGMEDGKIE